MERFQEAFIIAFANLQSNIIRSVLSITGVVIGIAAVIAILAIGAGVRKNILNQMNSNGNDVYHLISQYDEATQRIGEFESADLQKLQELSFVETVFPDLDTYKSVRSRFKQSDSRITGVDDRYLQSNKFKLIAGRNFSPIEAEQRNPICLINQQAAETLFNNQDPVGQSLYVDAIEWKIIGVYAPIEKAGKSWRSGERLEVLAPINALLRNSKDLIIRSVVVNAKPELGPQAVEEMMTVLIRNDPRRRALFRIGKDKEYYAKILQMQSMMGLVGALIAGISLIVGGIGMMNVMLTSVAERTREIGIRRAVGARQKDILFQFLIESCVLSGIGGMLGLVLGSALARAIPLLLKKTMTIQPTIEPLFMFLAVGMGVLLGAVFGFYPAIKASKLAPAEALRTE